MESIERSVLEYFDQNKSECAGASKISEKLTIPKDSVFPALRVLEKAGILKYAGFEQSYESRNGPINIEFQYKLNANG